MINRGREYRAIKILRSCRIDRGRSRFARGGFRAQAASPRLAIPGAIRYLNATTFYRLFLPRQIRGFLSEAPRTIAGSPILRAHLPITRSHPGHRRLRIVARSLAETAESQAEQVADFGRGLDQFRSEGENRQIEKPSSLAARTTRRKRPRGGDRGAMTSARGKPRAAAPRRYHPCDRHMQRPSVDPVRHFGGGGIRTFNPSLYVSISFSLPRAIDDLKDARRAPSALHSLARRSWSSS